MKITDARFVKSVYRLSDLPQPTLPEIAFSGRSNVGKSSLINTLLNRKGVAKTSSTPGRTQSINFIEVNRSLYFVDLPGYGYTQVPAAIKRKWQPLIEGYLKNRTALRLLILLIDARREPNEEEADFVAWLNSHKIPVLVILTKIDKLGKGNQGKSLNIWRDYLDAGDRILPFSAVTGEGKSLLWKKLNEHLHTNPQISLTK